MLASEKHIKMTLNVFKINAKNSEQTPMMNEYIRIQHRP